MADKFKTLLAEIKNAFDIVDQFRLLGFPMQQNGVNKWKTLCPFHKEKTPSFIVNESFQNYHCFGCGASGDIISFTQHYENLDFMDAIRFLADQKGIEIELEEDNGKRVDYESLRNILKLSANYYCNKFNKLPEDHVAKEQITSRGLTYDNRDPNKVKYGYSPDGNTLRDFLREKGYSDDLIVQSGVCGISDNGVVYDFFRGRLMFILTDKYNKPVGFSSRKLREEDKRGKYVNSFDNDIFHKSKVLYNHYLARQNVKDSNIIYVVEGQFDVSSFVEAGHANVVATSGTALTQQHVNELRKLLKNDGKIVLAFDGDSAGLEAVSKVFKNFPEIHEDTEVVIFPEGQDPCDYRQEHGNEEFSNYIKKTVPIVEFMIRQVRAKYDSTAVGQSKFLSEASSIVKTVTKKTLREAYIRLLSIESFTDINTIRDIVKNAPEYQFNQTYEAVIEVEEEEEVSDLSNSEIFAKIESNNYFNLVARFINLGLRRKAWRGGLVRSRDLMPKELHPFIDEVEALNEREAIFPELFDNDELATYFMRDDYSPFDKFMSLEETKDQYTYLHRMLSEKKREIIDSKKRKKIYQMLHQDESNNIEYLKKVLEA